jgi:hypothetical protein
MCSGDFTEISSPQIFFGADLSAMKRPNFPDHTSSAGAASGFPDTAGTSMSFPPSMWRHCRQVCNLPPGTVAELHQ